MKDTLFKNFIIGKVNHCLTNWNIMHKMLNKSKWSISTLLRNLFHLASKGNIYNNGLKTLIKIMGDGTGWQKVKGLAKEHLHAWPMDPWTHGYMDTNSGVGIACGGELGGGDQSGGKWGNL